jgi:hypothetical protein
VDVVFVCLRLSHGVDARLSMFPSREWMHVVVHPSIPAELKMIVETLALKSRLAKLSESQAFKIHLLFNSTPSS